MSWPIPSASQEGGSSTSTSFPKQQQQPALYLHPLSLYDFASTYSLSAYPNQKPLVDPAHLATMMIHTFVNTNSTDVQLVSQRAGLPVQVTVVRYLLTLRKASVGVLLWVNLCARFCS
jgi:hypothetical protein